MSFESRCMSRLAALPIEEKIRILIAAGVRLWLGRGCGRAPASPS
jgi:hypothetical protein